VRQVFVLRRLPGGIATAGAIEKLSSRSPFDQSDMHEAGAIENDLVEGDQLARRLREESRDALRWPCRRHSDNVSRESSHMYRSPRASDRWINREAAISAIDADRSDNPPERVQDDMTQPP